MSDCRLKGGGQAQTLSYIENAFLLRISEENAFRLGFLGGWGEGLQTYGWRPSANIENEENAFILRIYEGNAFILESHTT